MESRTKEGEEVVRNEGDVKSQDHLKEKCQLCHEREKVPFLTVTSVSIWSQIE